MTIISSRKEKLYFSLKHALFAYILYSRLTMKFIAIVGTNATKSYNRKLLQFMSSHFANQAQIEVTEIKDIPLFCEDYEQTPQSVLDLAQKIEGADGVIFGTPEYDHDIPAALKSVIEWLSWKVHPLTKRPVMIVGASLGNLGTVQAQESLRRILDSPGLGSFVLPGFQFLLGRAESAFDEKGNLLDPGTVSWLEQCFNGFIHYASALEKLQSAQKAQIKTSSISHSLDPQLKKQEAKSAFQALDEIDTTTGASETADMSFEEANGINFVLDDDIEFKLPDDPINTLETTTSPKVAPEPPVLVYTEDALTSASQTEPPKKSTPIPAVDTTTGASES